MAFPWLTNATDPAGGAVVRGTTPFITGRFHLRDRWTVKDFIETFNSGDEYTSELQVAAHEMRLAGRVMNVPDGVYGVSAQLTDAGDTALPLTIKGEGFGVSVLEQITAGAPAIWNSGSLGATRVVTVASAVGASSLTISDASGIVQGDVLNIIDTTVPVYGNSTRTIAASQSQHALVKSVAGNVVTFYGRLRYAYSTSATVQLLAAGGAVHVEALTMRNPTPGTLAGTDRAIQLAHLRDAVVKDVEFLDYDGAQIYMTNVVGWDVGGCLFKRARDLEQTTTPYCVMAKDGTSHGIMHDCTAEYVRHMYTTSAQAGAVSPQHNLVSDLTGWGCTQAVVDTHPGAPWHTFTNIEAHHCADALAQIRGPDSRVFDPVAIGCLEGVVFTDGAHRGKLMGGRLSGCDIAVTVNSSEDVTVGGGLVIDDAVTNALVYSRGASWAAFLNYKLTLGKIDVLGNPSGPAVELGNWNNAFRIERGPNGVWIPDATTPWGNLSVYTLASAATITIPQESDEWTVSGSTNITAINVDALRDLGRVVRLHFQGTLTMTDAGNLKLSANLNAVAGTSITLKSNGAQWYEQARSVN